VKDFMCHRKFTVDFGRHVNFITGQNGSGKSAIVAALQLCLGATARSTGRGSNMGALVREGADGPAVLQVTLLNEGSDAYLPECYGNRIIIERRIPRTGSSTYRLLNKDGTLVCNRKEELDKILQMFNLFADNPCCILTQEESKKFIQGHEKDKYNFFMKGICIFIPHICIPME
jgi:chromosome segregation ATPase